MVGSTAAVSVLCSMPVAVIVLPPKPFDLCACARFGAGWPDGNHSNGAGADEIGERCDRRVVVVAGRRDRLSGGPRAHGLRGRRDAGVRDLARAADCVGVRVRRSRPRSERAGGAEPNARVAGGGLEAGWKPKLGGSLPNAAPGVPDVIARLEDAGLRVLFVVEAGQRARLLADDAGRRRDAALAHSLGERRGLDRGADRDDLVGVHAVERRRAEERLDALAHERHARRAADEDDLVERRRREARERERVLRDLERAIDERRDHATRDRARVIVNVKLIDEPPDAVAELLEHARCASRRSRAPS